MPSPNPAPPSVEQMVRDLLTQALRDRLVAPDAGWADPDPQARSSGDLTGVANLLAAFLKANQDARDDRWQAAVGNTLEGCEELARPCRAGPRRRLQPERPPPRLRRGGRHDQGLGWDPDGGDGRGGPVGKGARFPFGPRAQQVD
jgi:hypothetical protein